MRQKLLSTPLPVLIFGLVLLFAFATGCGTCTQLPVPVTPTNTGDFVLLKEQITNDYRLVNDTLRFIYDESYNDTALKYKIYNNAGEVVYSDTDRSFPIRYGRNYITLPLPLATFSPWARMNPLLLEVRNAKNRKYYLKFQYRP